MTLLRLFDHPARRALPSDLCYRRLYELPLLCVISYSRLLQLGTNTVPLLLLLRSRLRYPYCSTNLRLARALTKIARLPAYVATDHVLAVHDGAKPLTTALLIREE